MTLPRASGAFPAINASAVLKSSSLLTVTDSSMNA